MLIIPFLIERAYAQPVVAPLTSATTLKPAEFVNSTFSSIADLVALIAGSLAIIYIVLAGIRYIMAGSAPDRVKSARAGAVNAAIGIAIVVGAYGIIRLAVIIGNQISASVH